MIVLRLFDSSDVTRLGRCAVLLLGACGTDRATQPPPAQKSHYVSPTGTSAGDGTQSQPWDLGSGLAGAAGRVQPGDTIWLRGGTYRGAHRSTVTGAPGSAVVVRQYPGERAILDAAGATTDSVRGDFLTVGGDYTVLWGLELTDSDPNRATTTRPNMIVNDASHTKYINLVVHDGGIGFYNYPTRSDVEVNGCIIYNNGWSVGGRGGGHALYVRSDAGPLVLRDNVLFDQYGYGIHAYSDAGRGMLNNIRTDGNVSFNNGLLAGNPSGANILVGGFEPADGSVGVDNMTYFSPGVNSANVRLGWSPSKVLNGSLTFTHNYVVGGTLVLDVHSWRQATVTGNTVVGGGASKVVHLEDSTTTGYNWASDQYYHDPMDTAWSYHGRSYTFGAWQAATGLGTTDQAAGTMPAEPVVLVRPNLYAPGRAHIVVYNWGHAGAVPVDVAAVLRSGDAYLVRSVQALFDPPLVSGVYTGGSINLPMSQRLPPTPVGLASSPAPATLPEFDVFLLTRAP